MKSLGRAVTRFSMTHAKLVTWLMAVSTIALVAASVLPNIVPGLDFLPSLSVDSDPENMLSEDEPSRVMHNRIREKFGISDAIFLGIVNEAHPDGVFNVETLRKVDELTSFAKTLDGVTASEVMSVSTVDDMKSEGVGRIRFSWMMEEPPTTQDEAREIGERAMRNPMLNDTLVSKDRKVIAVYIPLTDKKLARDIMVKMQEKATALGEGDDVYHFAGLPIAQVVFGVEMFQQMAVSAPAAMLVIFLLMWFYFRKLVVIAAPMIVAMVAALSTMGLLVVTGNTIHIMSSMIPIFIMPIAVLNSIHIISDFFESYRKIGDTRKTMSHVMDDLHAPMLFTSLTTTAGFGSLVFTPIPPVQVFGFFIAAGVMISWLWTITFLPAFVSLLPERTFRDFGRIASEEAQKGALGAFVNRNTYRYAPAILAGVIGLVGLSAYGIGRININDNPTRWFEDSHPIRKADRVLNEHFGGTYDAYLTLQMPEATYSAEAYAATLARRAADQAQAVNTALLAYEAMLAARNVDDAVDDAEGFLDAVSDDTRAARKQAPAAQVPGWTAALDFLDEQYAVLDEQPENHAAFDTAAFAEELGRASAAHRDAVARGFDTLQKRIAETASTGPTSAAGFRESLRWGATDLAQRPALSFVSQAEQFGEVFKDPVALEWLDRFEQALSGMTGVGKSNSLAGLTKTVYRDLLSGEQRDFRLPDRRSKVAQTLEQYTSSHRKDDLWHFVTPDYRASVLWLQLQSADNQMMEQLIPEVDTWVAANPPPLGLGEPLWSGMTYINVAWQQKMVSGMLNAFGGSFLIVFLMMVFLFRSVLWGILSMIPLTVTVGTSYGALGLIGKDYDMPVAVLSSLSLGLAVDYAIHFIARSRELYKKLGSWDAARAAVFAEPARAISRNVVVVGVGFLPLLLSPLVPYQTVGILIASILILAGGATLIILPAIIAVLQRWLFRTAATADMSSSTPNVPPAERGPAHSV